ncbi:hypothetical protein [Nocardia pseudovaccinii]|uniref:hypothetical protein n=1 Tax=Nocardia pseudovaccinii TaxID=189540 RepID=UPI0007A3E137|nr:hypothetical protein [Nocardia pseudovaccinii]
MSHAIRWRRRVGWVLAVIFVLFVFPGLVGAVANAQYLAAATGSGVSEIDGLSWMHIRDSSGVPLANYAFATDHGGVLDPGSTILWAILGFEFIGYIAIVTTAIWLIGNALSFQWLNMFGSALTGVADRLTGQIATPMLLITAATIGAFCVAWFWLRGYHAKAMLQVVTMLGVAVLGPVFLAEPLGDVLSSDGLLAKGRDLGISVAAGLNGNNNPNPNQLVTTMQRDLADNFARGPVQVWNFGHVVDEQPACRSVWSTGMTAGDDERVRKGMQSCGDSAAYAKAQNPTMGQVGTGLMLLICGGILLAFAVVLGIRVIKAALDAIYHGFMSIFGFAAGGFVYGPTQTFLVRNLVDSIVAAGRMTAYTIFLGVYVLFMGNLFAQAKGQTMAVIVIAGTVEIGAISQLKRLNRSLSRGNDWIANRFALAIQGRPVTAGSGGVALGMGTSRSGGSMSGSGLITGLAAINTANTSPVLAWLAMKTPKPLDPNARLRKEAELINMRIAASHMTLDQQEELRAARKVLDAKATSRAAEFGGIHDHVGAAHAWDGLGDMDASYQGKMGSLTRLDLDAKKIGNIAAVHSIQKASTPPNPFEFAPRAKAQAALQAAVNRPGSAIAPELAGQAHVAAYNFRNNAPVAAPNAAIDHGLVNDVTAAIQNNQALDTAIDPDRWSTADKATLQHIGRNLASDYFDAVHTWAYDSTDQNLAAAMTRLEHAHMFDGLTDGLVNDPWGGLRMRNLSIQPDDPFAQASWRSLGQP